MHNVPTQAPHTIGVGRWIVRAVFSELWCWCVGGCVILSVPRWFDTNRQQVYIQRERSELHRLLTWGGARRAICGTRALDDKNSRWTTYRQALMLASTGLHRQARRASNRLASRVRGVLTWGGVWEVDDSTREQEDSITHDSRQANRASEASSSCVWKWGEWDDSRPAPSKLSGTTAGKPLRQYASYFFVYSPL